MGTCLRQEHTSLATTVASSVIATGVNRIGTALEEAAKARTDSALAQRNILLSNRGALGPCVFVARGWFHVGGGSGGALGKFDKDDEALRSLGLNLAAEPDFYFEGLVYAANNRTAYTIAPVRTWFGEPQVSNRIRGDQRSISVSFAFVPLGKPIATTTGGTTVVIGSMEAGEERLSTPVWCARALGGSAGNDCTGSETDAYGFILGQDQSEWFTVALTPDLQPMTLAALVTETRDASAFLGFVAAVFKKNEASIASEMDGALIPSVRDANRETEQTAREAAEGQYDGAWSKANVALTACNAQGSAAATWLTARTELRTFIQIGRRAERTVAPLEAALNGIRLDDGAAARAACTIGVAELEKLAPGR